MDYLSGVLLTKELINMENFAFNVFMVISAAYNANLQFRANIARGRRSLYNLQKASIQKKYFAHRRSNSN
jgi:hypothetical protein